MFLLLSPPASNQVSEAEGLYAHVKNTISRMTRRQMMMTLLWCVSSRWRNPSVCNAFCLLYECLCVSNDDGTVFIFSCVALCAHDDAFLCSVYASKTCRMYVSF